MNENYAMMNQDPMNQEPEKVPEKELTDEAKIEENKKWQMQASTPEAVVESQQLTWLKVEEIDELKSRWNSIQIEFVDEPRKSVEQADTLLVEALEKINHALANKRTMLNESWANHEDMSTEDLRIALQGYRTFLNRLLAL
jgi:hypothetical protein